MHDPHFDHRLDPNVIQLLPQRGARLFGAALLSFAVAAPVLFFTGLLVVPTH